MFNFPFDPSQISTMPRLPVAGRVNPANVVPTPMQKLVGYTDPSGMEVGGMGPLALGAFSGLANTFMGMKQYGLAKDMFKRNQEEFERNYAAQRTLTNAELEDRQRARVASNPGGYVSVGEYMKQNGVV